MTTTTGTLDRDGLLARGPWEAHDAQCQLVGGVDVTPDGGLELVAGSRGIVAHLHSARGEMVVLAGWGGRGRVVQPGDRISARDVHLHAADD